MTTPLMTLEEELNLLTKFHEDNTGCSKLCNVQTDEELSLLEKVQKKYPHGYGHGISIAPSDVFGFLVEVTAVSVLVTEIAKTATASQGGRQKKRILVKKNLS